LKWSKETGTMIKEFVGHEFTILSLAVNEISLYTGSVDQTIIQWNKETGEQIRIISGILNFIGLLI
jgi:WD40 repeat protein